MFAIFGWTVDRDLDRSCAMCAGSATSIAGNRLNDPNSLRFCDMFGDLFQELGKVDSPPGRTSSSCRDRFPIRWGITGSASFYSNRYQGSFTPLGSTGEVANNG